MFEIKINKYTIRKIRDYPQDTYYRIKYFIQRGKRGYADCDVWQADYHATSVMLGMLKDLRQHAHGHPVYDEVQTFEDWEKALDTMIEGFEAAKRVIEDNYYLDTNADILTRDPTGKEVQGWRIAYEVDHEKFNQMMPLFTKYFFHLWD
jgi:hypothetical protein